MIKNVIFDIGNVLADFRWEGFLQEFGYDRKLQERIAKASVLTPDWNEYDRGMLTDEEVIERFVRNDPEIADVIRKTFQNVSTIASRRATSIPWITELKEKGLGVYVLSNFSHKAYEDCQKALDFLPFTDGGILSFRDKVIKPDEAIYRLLMNRYGLKADECVFIDDTAHNLPPAEALGMKTIRFVTHEQAVSDLNRILEEA